MNMQEKSKPRECKERNGGGTRLSIVTWLHQVSWLQP